MTTEMTSKIAESYLSSSEEWMKGKIKEMLGPEDLMRFEDLALAVASNPGYESTKAMQAFLAEKGFEAGYVTTGKPTPFKGRDESWHFPTVALLKDGEVIGSFKFKVKV